MTAFVPSRGTLVAGVVALSAALAVAWAARYGLVENTPLGHACEAGESSFLCSVRFAVNEGFRTIVPGLLTVAAGAWCLWRPGPLPFVATLALAGFGLLLFNAWPAGLALVLAILALARPVRA